MFTPGVERIPKIIFKQRNSNKKDMYKASEGPRMLCYI